MSTYYIPRAVTTIGSTKTYINPKGKLVDKYRNLRYLFKWSSVRPLSSDENQDELNVETGN